MSRYNQHENHAERLIVRLVWCGLVLFFVLMIAGLTGLFSKPVNNKNVGVQHGDGTSDFTDR